MEVYYSIILGYEGMFRVAIKDKDNSYMQRLDKECGNYYETEEEAQKVMEYMKQVLNRDFKTKEEAMDVLDKLSKAREVTR